MKIGMLVAISDSSRGDVEPYVALAKALQARGHQPRLICEDTFEPFARSHGVDCVPVAGLKPPDDGVRGIRALRLLRQWVEEHVKRQMGAAAEACQDVDALTASESMFSFIVGYEIAEILKVPFLATLLTPVGMTGAFPNPTLGMFWTESPFLNRATYRLAARTVRSLTFGPVNEARKAILGLAPRGRSERGFLGALYGGGLPVLYGYSPSFLPKPPDWSADAHVTGYWFLDQSIEPPPSDLEGFLEDGEPPVCIALGRGLEFGIKQLGADRFWSLILQGLAKSGRRGVIITSGYPPPSRESAPGRVFLVKAVPHRWLFPRVRAVVHHAGAGTTGAALRAGIPSVPVPAAWDQFFWARQLERTGAGTSPMPIKKLDALELAALIDRAASDPGIARHAKEISARIQAESGPGEAARLVDHYLSAG
jgi:sterol 3beta-glucosyltransferase